MPITYTYTYYLRVLFLSFLVFTLSTSCSKDDEEQNIIPPSEISVELNQGSSIFTWNAAGRWMWVNTTGNWTLSISYPEGQPQGWCRIRNNEHTGTGEKNLWIIVDNNPGDTKREALITVTLTATGHQVELPVEQYGSNPDTGALELPEIDKIEWFLTYTMGEFALEYYPEKKHSKWVAWRLHNGHIRSGNRTNAWQWDRRIPERYWPLQADFSGYDRGHLCPSADRSFSREMNAETFMYSNMTPQDANLNRNVWENLENRTRSWASGLDTLYICAGGTVMKEEHILRYTSPSAMAVPKYNFKVILRKRAGTGALDAIGFWFENRSYAPRTQVNVTDVKTVREIEELTGFNFFHNLPQNVQDAVETVVNPAAWGIPN